MTDLVSAHLLPRKTPRQRRSAATVAAISEAAVQVLLTHGAGGLTTTRVAGRAGVSVGTMYQYFPNKSALLHDVLTRHLGRIGDAVDRIGRTYAGKYVAAVAEGFVSDYLDAKIANVDVSRALYRLLPEIGAGGLQASLFLRMEDVLRDLLRNAPDADFADLDAVVTMLRLLLVSTVRTVIEEGATPRHVDIVRSELKAVVLRYLS